MDTNTNTNTNDIFEKMEKVIPSNLWEKYAHLSFGEMAETEELESWSSALRQAEEDWFRE